MNISSINKAAFRIIGLFAIIASAAFLAINVSQLSKLTTAESFFYQIIDLALNCIGIYGGFQLMQLRKVGHQLLTIWLLCRIFTAFLIILMLVTNLFFAGDNQFAVPVPVLLPFVMAYYVFSPVVLVYLFSSRTARELLVDDNPRHTRIVLRLLSLLTPGLARALVGNLLVGMILFYVYSGLIVHVQILNLNSELRLPGFYFTSSEPYLSFFNFFSKVVLWAVFARVDWEIVKDHEKSRQEQLIPIPNLDSSQSNSG